MEVPYILLGFKPIFIGKNMYKYMYKYDQTCIKVCVPHCIFSRKQCHKKIDITEMVNHHRDTVSKERA